MKVMNLGCSHSHVFEGWFGSEDDFQSQLQRGLLACPVCGDQSVHKLPSAPRLNLRSAVSEPVAAKPAVAAAKAQPNMPEVKLQKALMHMVRELVAKSEDVGERFTEEARRMHYGETEQRNIRGQATLKDAAELAEEGIDVLPLPDLPGLKDTLQ